MRGGGAGAGDRWTLPAPGGFRLAPTVHSHGAFQCPPFRWMEDGEGTGHLLRVLRVAGADGREPRPVRIREEWSHDTRIGKGEDGRVELTTERVPTLVLEAPGWTPSEEEGVEMEEAVVFMLSLDRDLSSFHDLCRRHRTLKRIPEIGAGRMLRCPTLWEECSKAICGTNVRWDQAVTMIERICLLGDPVEPDDGLRLPSDLHAWPEPGDLLEAGEGYLRDEARVGYRAGSLLELAQGFASGRIDPGPVEAGFLEGDELRSFFRELPGIGPATANLLATVYGHADVLWIDRGVRAFVRDHHFGGRVPSDEEIRELYEPFGEWRALVHWFEFVQEVWWPAVGVSV